jgi:hypothetical protein
MSNANKLRGFIEKCLINYRIQCDMALSDRNMGLITQAEYETALARIGLLKCDAILQAIEAELPKLTKAIIDDDEGIGWDNAILHVKSLLASARSGSKT